VADRARTQFLSAVLLVVVFATGGLVGAAVAGQGDGVGAASPAPVAMPSSDSERPEEAGSSERNYQYMFERAGATEAQAERIRAEIFPWFQQALDELWADSAVQALDDTRDSLRREYRAADRALEEYYDPRRAAIRDSARALIREVLDPQAQVVYDSLVAERDRSGRDGNRRP